MSRAIRVAVIVGNPRPLSRTADVARVTAQALIDGLTSVGVDAVLAELLDLAAVAPDQVAEAVERAAAAEVIVVATPTFKGAYTGLLKIALDTVPTGRWRGRIAIPVQVTGSQRHALAADVHLRPVLLELGASTPTSAVVVTEADLADDRSTDLVRRWAAQHIAHVAGVAVAVQESAVLEETSIGASA